MATSLLEHIIETMLAGDPDNLQEMAARIEKFIDDRDAKIAEKIKTMISDKEQDTGLILQMFNAVNEDILAEEA